MLKKIYILNSIKSTPWGGANQFLKALRKEFLKKNVYTKNIDEADVILVSSNPSQYFISLVEKCIQISKKYPRKIIINRIDGPVHLYRGNSLYFDELFYLFDKKLCSGTVFQSKYSKELCLKTGMQEHSNNVIILNASDQNLFSKKSYRTLGAKTKIIATSWSSNMRKGFEVYKWLDENLDFSKYEMTFVGNSPIPFKNINHIPPVETKLLAEHLRANDIYLTASQKDPCSNSLIEALSIGLPTIGLNDGGHPEIIGKGGEVFDKVEEIPALLQKIENNYEAYMHAIQLSSIEQIAAEYITFFEGIIQKRRIINSTKRNFWQLKKKIISVKLNMFLFDKIKQKLQ